MPLAIPTSLMCLLTDIVIYVYVHFTLLVSKKVYRCISHNDEVQTCLHLDELAYDGIVERDVKCYYFHSKIFVSGATSQFCSYKLNS